jgi:hypothetical protein
MRNTYSEKQEQAVSTFEHIELACTIIVVVQIGYFALKAWCQYMDDEENRYDATVRRWAVIRDKASDARRTKVEAYLEKWYVKMRKRQR